VRVAPPVLSGFIGVSLTGSRSRAVNDPHDLRSKNIPMIRCQPGREYLPCGTTQYALSLMAGNSLERCAAIDIGCGGRTITG
jgi:hypothetical protein